MEKVKCTNEQFDDIARRFLNKEITRGEAIKLSGYKVAWFSTKLSIYRQKNGISRKQSTITNKRDSRNKNLTNEFQKFLNNCGESIVASGIPYMDYCILKDVFMENARHLTRQQKEDSIYEFETEIRKKRISKRGGPNNANPCIVTLADGRKETIVSLYKAAMYYPVASYNTIYKAMTANGYFTKDGITFKYKNKVGDK